MPTTASRIKASAITLIVAASTAVVIGFPTGLALMVLFRSDSPRLWLIAFPVVVGIVAALVQRWHSRRRLAGQSRLPALLIASVNALLLAGDAAIILGGVAAGDDCRWEDSDEVAAVTELTPGLGVTGDAGGRYVDGEDRVDTFIKHSLKLAMTEPALWPATPKRQLVVDLTRPVADSGAESLGVLSTGVWIKSFWFQDASRMVRTVHGIREGATVASDRTDIMVDVEGRRHLLTMGRWSGEYCEGIKANGAGTSDATITRTGAEEFLVEALPGSIARLWDIAGGEPRDRGLYQVSLRARFSGAAVGESR